MTQITVTHESIENKYGPVDNYTTYSFTEKKVEYSVVTRNHETFDVYSNRFPGNFRRGTLKVYFSVEELAARSAFFANFTKGLKSLVQIDEIFADMTPVILD